MKLLKKAMAFTLAALLLVSMLPVSVAAENASTPVCAQLDGCAENAHNTECPLYVAPPTPCSVTGCEKTAGHGGECTVNCAVTSGCNKKHGHEGECFVPCSVSGCEKTANHGGECTVNCIATSGCNKKNGHEGECTVNCITTSGCNKKNGHEGDCFVPCSVTGCEKTASHEGECTVSCTETSGCNKMNGHDGDCVVPCNHTYSAWDWFADEENDGENSTFLRTCSTCSDIERDESPELIEQIMGSDDPADVRSGVAAAVEAGAITQDAADVLLATLNIATNEIKDTDVAKIDDIGYATLQAAFDVGGAVTLLKDVVLTDGLEVASGKSVVLNLAGFNISYTSSETTGNAAITNRGTLTINGSGEITYSSTAPSANNAYGTNTISNEAGTLTINGATIKNTTGSGASYAIDNNNSAGAATLSIQSGTVSGVKTAIRAFANSASAVNSITISDGSVSGSYTAIWIHLPSSDTSVAPPVDLNITGGNLSGGENYAFYTYSFGNSYSGVDIDISNGTFTGRVYLYKNESMDITGGSFNSGITVKDTTSEKVNISGGTFAVEPSAAFIANGYKITKDNEKFVIEDVTINAAVGSGSEQTYTITEVVAAAGVNATATQSVPITVSESQTSGSNSVPAALITAVADSPSNIDIAIPVQVSTSGTQTAEATVTFNNDAVDKIAEVNSSVTLSVEKVTDASKIPDAVPNDAVVYEITLKNGNNPVVFDDDTVTGTATVTLPNPSANANVIVCYYDSDGNRDPIATQATSSNATFTTSHFSTYVIEAAGVSVNNTNYDTFAEALTAAPSGATIKLLKDVALTADMTINKSITLDLNGFTISGNGCICIDGDGIEVTILNEKSTGGITAKGSSPEANIRVTNNADKLNLTGVKVSGAEYGLRIEESVVEDCTVNINSGTEISSNFAGITIRKANTLNVENGAKVSGKYYGISGNGNADQGGTTINIKGGIVEATDATEGVGIFHPQLGELNISGGTVQGRTGVEIRSGELNVTGGTIKGTGALTVTPTGNGPTTFGAAVAVAQHTTNNDITVTISNGTLSATGAALSVANPQNNTTNLDDVKVAVNGGTFNGPLNVVKNAYGTGSEKIVSGGTFDKAVPSELAASKFTPIQNTDGTYGVAQNPDDGTDFDKQTVDKTITIVWDDKSDDMDKRPNKVEVILKAKTADGTTETTHTLEPGTSNTSNSWTKELELSVYTTPATGSDKLPQLIEYSVELAEAIDDYKTTYSKKNPFTITNKINIVYQILTGAKQTVVIGSQAKFTSNGDCDKFVKLWVNDKKVDEDDRSVTKGSTVVTLTSDFVKELGVGTHSLTIEFSDGYASTTFKIKKPTVYVAGDTLLQTGQQNAPMFLMGILGTAALAAGFWFLLAQKKERYEN